MEPGLDPRATDAILKFLGREPMKFSDLLSTHQYLLTIPTPSAKMRECIDHLETAIHKSILAIQNH